MDLFDILSLIGGLSLFLFGMSIMGDSLERRAGGRLKNILSRLTSNALVGLLTGLGVTAVIQSSSATTVMVVGFVNSGLMNLRQAIPIIMGANVGTTVTAWILSLSGISGDHLFIKLLKPTSFTPILALIGIALFLAGRNGKQKDSGSILLGFATLMFGMDAMSDAVKGLAEVEGFRALFLLFKNPVLGVLAGAVLTAIIQSSSASVGILQALAGTGQVSYAAAIPIIMGQNIGTCVTAMISSVGTNKNARRAAAVHLAFNIIGTVLGLLVFGIVGSIFAPPILEQGASIFGIAVCHSIFNVFCVVALFPASGLLEKLANRLVPAGEETVTELDERLLAAPPIALERCNQLVHKMAQIAMNSIQKSIAMPKAYDKTIAQEIRDLEEKADHYEDILGTYLVKLSSHRLSESDSATVSKLLKLIGDLERISDHSVNLLESAEELQEKKIVFTPAARKELQTLCAAVREICALATDAYLKDDLATALEVEPLEQVIDGLKAHLRNQHIVRLKGGECTIEAGFVWADLLTDLERIADHCSNIAVCVMDAAGNNMNQHAMTVRLKGDAHFKEQCEKYAQKYAL
ncbi:MAG: Na/Pi cotransporter family protein [Clostridia bacterium]|nr:Na/Pi cotransporter family protein [Clostridia bacterium]